MEKRLCKICGVEKNIEMFALGRRSIVDNKQFYKMTCKKCDNRLKVEMIKLNPIRNKKRIDNSKVRTKRHYHKNIFKSREYCRRKRFEYEYNLTVEQVQEMKESQDHKCLICGKTKFLVVDHCHTNNRVRGMLCSTCNSAIGFFDEDEDIFLSAIKYINYYKEKFILDKVID